MGEIRVRGTDGMRAEGEEKEQIRNRVWKMEVAVNRNRKKKTEKGR